MDAPGGPLAVLGEVLAQTCGLVAPRQCPCGREGTRLCPDCAALLAGPPRRVEDGCDALQLLTAARTTAREVDGALLPAGVDHTPLLPVLALGEYGGDLQRLVLAWKNGGMLHLARPLAAALAPAVAQLMGGEALADGGGLADGGELTDDGEFAECGELPALVPVPSRRAARLRRGEDHTAELVRHLERAGAGTALLLRARPTTSQEGQGARQRRTRRIALTGRRAREAGRRGRTVVLVDDVVTTGSTLRGMHEALTAAGMQVRGAVVVAASRLPHAGARVPGGVGEKDLRPGHAQ